MGHVLVIAEALRDFLRAIGCHPGSFAEIFNQAAELYDPDELSGALSPLVEPSDNAAAALVQLGVAVNNLNSQKAEQDWRQACEDEL